jgi:hypothetical protein
LGPRLSEVPLAPGEAALPPQVPIADAARSVSTGQTTTVSKWIDTGTVVIAPLLVPAAVLATVRSGPGRTIFSGLTLGEMAFGVVAVAFAALARSLTGKSEGWKLVAAAGVITIVFETAIAISRDSLIDSERLVKTANDCQSKCASTALHELTARIADSSPSTVDWVVAAFFGLLLCSCVILAIWRES